MKLALLIAVITLSILVVFLLFSEEDEIVFSYSVYTTPTQSIMTDNKTFVFITQNSTDWLTVTAGASSIGELSSLEDISLPVDATLFLTVP